MSLSVDTLTDEVEHYLLRRQYIVRTPRGRRATPLAYLHLGLAAPAPEPEAPSWMPVQKRLFNDIDA